MIINEELINFIRNLSSLQHNTNIYITDLDNVIFTIINNKVSTVTHPIHKSLLRNLFSYDLNCATDNFSCFENINTISIFEDTTLNTNCNLQVIFPIIIDDKIAGSIITTSNSNFYNYSQLQFTEATAFFLRKLILKQLNAEFKSKKTNGEVNL